MTGHSHSLRILLALAVTFGAVAETHASAPPAPPPAPAPDDHSVLILDTTVTGASESLEAQAAAALGLTPVVVDAQTWGAMTTAQFATYRAIVLGDPTCVEDTGPLAPAETNRTVWSPATTGNLIIIGSDPTFHAPSVPGAAKLISTGIGFAAAGVGKTGAYITLSCYYSSAEAGTPVPLLDQFGTFKVVGQADVCPADSHIVAVHPALAGLADADLSNWVCSTHEGFLHPDGWPPNFLVLVLSKDVPSSFVAPDGTTGAPYILARGEDLSPVLCGNGVLDTDEECDDGNTVNGDGCTAQCKMEPFCGDGILNTGEECDDGNAVNGDGCTTQCRIEPLCGNGILNTGEECDDANTVNGDLCTAQCELPEATPVVPKKPPLCNAGCKVRIECNSATGCRNRTFLLVPRNALRLSGEAPAKARKPIAFAKSSITNIPPGGSKRVTLRLTAKGKDFLTKTKKRKLTGFIEIRNTAGTAVSSTPITVRLKK